MHDGLRPAGLQQLVRRGQHATPCLHKLGKNISQATLAGKYGVGKADGSAVAIEKIPACSTAT